MSLLDQVIDPVIFESLDPGLQNRIQLGVEAGARQATVLELNERLRPELSNSLSPALSRVLGDAVSRPALADAKTAIAKFQGELGG